MDGLPVPVGGDVVIAADGEPIHSMDDLILSISQHQPGDQMTLTVLRNDEEIEVSVTLAARPEDFGSQSRH
jgi:S1-C subfamily serine protease